jgi:DNA-directed RNA polymerase subunit RPC12/RpoP
MGYKVHDLRCSHCGHEVVDYVHEDSDVFPITCESCSQTTMELQFPSPVFSMHDEGESIARKKNAAAAYRLRAKAYNHKHDSEERKGMLAEAKKIMLSNTKCAATGQKED